MTESGHSGPLVRPLICYRIGDPHGLFPIYDDGGARLFAGRWHDVSHPVIYASEHYSTAMLETLVYLGGRLPPNQHYVEITIPAGTSCETVTKELLPGWDDPLPSVSVTFGTHWVAQARSAILLVPSYVARIERNVVINPAHPQAAAVTVSAPQPVWWDERLFR